MLARVWGGSVGFKGGADRSFPVAVFVVLVVVVLVLVVVPVVVLIVLPVLVIEILIVAFLVLLVVVDPTLGLLSLFEIELVPGVEVQLLDFAIQPLHADDRIVGIDGDDLEVLLTLQVFVPLARGRIEITAHEWFLDRHTGTDGLNQLYVPLRTAGNPLPARGR